MSDLGGNAKEQLAGYIERIESLVEEKKQVAERIKSEFTSAAAEGFDRKAIQQIIKDRAADAQKTVEMRAIVESYRKALGALAGTALGDWARQWVVNDARLQRREQVDTSDLDEMLRKRQPKDAD